MQQNKTTLVQLPLTTLGQETRWAYSTTPPSPHGAKKTKSYKAYENIKYKNIHYSPPRTGSPPSLFYSHVIQYNRC